MPVRAFLDSDDHLRTRQVTLVTRFNARQGIS